MYIYFEDPIEKEFINTLIEKIDIEDEVHLYFATDGGYYDVMKFFVDFLNTKENITIHLIECVQSAGTMLLTDFKGKLIIEEGFDFFMFHKFDRQIYTLRKNSYCDDKLLVSQTDELNKNFAKKLKKKGILTAKQIKQFMQGKDVVVYREQSKTWNIWKI
jgi:hypothetical protein